MATNFRQKSQNYGDVKRPHSTIDSRHVYHSQPRKRR